MKVVIIDDEQHCHEAIIYQLAISAIPLQLVGQAYDMPEGVALVKQQEPDLLFLDIDMPSGNGFELLDQVDYAKYAVIFVTGYEERAITAFEYSAIDFIIKPITSTTFDTAVKRAKNRFDNESAAQRLRDLERAKQVMQGTPPPSIQVNNSDGIHFILVTEITHVKTDNGCCEIYKSDGSRIVISRNLVKLEPLFVPYPNLLKVHQSTVVNTHFIKKISGSDIFLRDNNNTKLAVSRSKAPVLRKALGL